MATRYNNRQLQFLWNSPKEETREQVRSSGQEPLGETPAPPIQGDQGSRELLRDARGGDRGRGGSVEREHSGRGSTERVVSGQGGPSERSEDERGVASFAGASTAPGRGRQLGPHPAEHSASYVAPPTAAADDDESPSTRGARDRETDAALQSSPASDSFEIERAFAPRVSPSRSERRLAASGPRARAAANVTALRALRTLQREGRAATQDELADLARWSGWGALPAVFDTDAASY